MRPVVSYDDITLPYESISAVVQETAKMTSNGDFSNRTSTPATKSSKRRKRKSRYSAAASSGNSGHNTSNGVEDDADADYLEVEESRELTHEEIWDDSALIEAWNAATEEYKAYHGPDKGWKDEPVHKSPLWYNTPPPPSKKQKTSHSFPPNVVDTAAPIENSNLTSHVSTIIGRDDPQPIDGDIPVPIRDAGLSSAETISHTVPRGNAVLDSSPHYAVLHPGEKVSQDEAFKRALEATYWSGYWTAIYHSQNHKKNPENDSIPGQESDLTRGVGEGEDAVADDAQMVEEDVHAILDISNDGNFEGSDDLFDGEGEEEGGQGAIEDGGQDNDSVASSSKGDLVSTQR
ncbi:hypothetical protein FB446DRAFT_786545 [Lentinula raphanica]|nr:hypothetical protein FB446DRAFT_786545 [Lentinula raphanica]